MRHIVTVMSVNTRWGSNPSAFPIWKLW